MIVILAPARNVQPGLAEGVDASGIIFPDEVETLAGCLRGFSPWQLESLLDLNPERALEMHRSYAGFDMDNNIHPAILSYHGEVYRRMETDIFTADDLAYAQGHVRILSALYGLLRPLDGIQNYRLNMKKSFKPCGQDLYCFWGDKVYTRLMQEGQPVVNLASGEYSEMITPYLRQGEYMINCRFLVDREGSQRRTVPAIRAARGYMVGYIIRNRIQEPEQLKGFDEDGYRFTPGSSTAREYVFVKQG